MSIQHAIQAFPAGKLNIRSWMVRASQLRALFEPVGHKRLEQLGRWRERRHICASLSLVPFLLVDLPNSPTLSRLVFVSHMIYVPYSFINLYPRWHSNRQEALLFILRKGLRHTQAILGTPGQRILTHLHRTSNNARFQRPEVKLQVLDGLNLIGVMGMCGYRTRKLDTDPGCPRSPESTCMRMAQVGRLRKY